MKLKDLSIENRPREKALKYGLETLSNEELLAIIIGSGTKQQNAIELATRVLSECGGLKGLFNSSLYSLKMVKGIKNAKALAISSMIMLASRQIKTENPLLSHADISSTILHIQKRLLDNEQESFYIVVLNRLGKIVKEKALYLGTPNCINICFRDIIREVFLVHGYSLYLIHTHPSSFALPSIQDIKTTKTLRKKLKASGIRLIDHYIVNKDDYISINEFMSEEGQKLIN